MSTAFNPPLPDPPQSNDPLSWVKLFTGLELNTVTSLEPVPFQVLWRLRLYYLAAGPIPLADEQLRPILRSVHCSLKKFHNKIRFALEQFFYESDGFLIPIHEERQRGELAAAKLKSIETGRIGGLQRVQNMKRRASDFQGGLEPTLNQAEQSRAEQDLASVCNAAAASSLENIYKNQAAAALQQQAENLTGEEEQTNPPPRGPSQIQAEVVSVFGSTSQQFIWELMSKARRSCPGVSESQVVDAMRATYRPGQQSAGLWLKTVPEYLANGGGMKKPMNPVEQLIADSRAKLQGKSS